MAKRKTQYEPLGSYLGYFGYNGYSDDWENDPYWSIIGYPTGVAGGQRPSFQGSVTSDDTAGAWGRTNWPFSYSVRESNPCCQNENLVS